MITRSIDKAREAYKKKNVEATKMAHSQHEPHKTQGYYLKSIVYGGLDGIITTFAVVAGVAGASLSAGIVLILGFANLLGDGISMAIGDYLSTRAEQEFHKAERKREEWEVKNYPEGEKKEMVELYIDKGLNKRDAEKMVSIISKNKKSFVDIMMVEELGIIESDESPIKNAFATFISFAFFGFIPLIVYIMNLLPGINIPAFPAATALTGLTLFSLGTVKVRITGMNWFKSGIEMLFVGSLAAGAAYLVGYFLSGLA